MKVLWEWARVPLAFLAIVILGLTIFNAVVTGKSLLPAPKPTSEPTASPLIHGGGESDVTPECGRDMMLPNDMQEMLALVVVTIPIEYWPAEARSRDFAGTAWWYMHDDGMKFRVGFWDVTHEFVEVIVIIGIYEICGDGTIDLQIDGMMMLEKP